MTDAYSIQRYSTPCQTGVSGVILPIQTEEFGIAIIAEQQPELVDIEKFYQQGNGNFGLAHAGRQQVLPS